MGMEQAMVLSSMTTMRRADAIANRYRKNPGPLL
jgi:hypothetical protein